MAIKMMGCNFEGNDVAIHAPETTDMEISNTTFCNNGVAMDIFVSAATLQSLGLPENTPQEYLREVFVLLEQEKDKPQEVQLQLASESKLFKWLGNGASIATIFSALIEFVKSM